MSLSKELVTALAEHDAERMSRACIQLRECDTLAEATTKDLLLQLSGDIVLAANSLDALRFSGLLIRDEKLYRSFLEAIHVLFPKPRIVDIASQFGVTLFDNSWEIRLLRSAVFGALRLVTTDGSSFVQMVKQGVNGTSMEGTVARWIKHSGGTGKDAMEEGAIAPS